jgi:predicted transcriptional regulator
MALSQTEVAAKLNAEYVAGNLIVGERSERVFVGKTSQDGVFTITEEGEALLAALETAKPTTKKATKAEAAE